MYLMCSSTLFIEKHAHRLEAATLVGRDRAYGVTRGERAVPWKSPDLDFAQQARVGQPVRGRVRTRVTFAAGGHLSPAASNDSGAQP